MSLTQFVVFLRRLGFGFDEALPLVTGGGYGTQDELALAWRD
jgi:hypothetical protein